MEFWMWWSLNWEKFIAFGLGFAVVMMAIVVWNLKRKVEELEILAEKMKIDSKADYLKILQLESFVRGEIAGQKADISSLRETLHMDEYGDWCENFGKEESEKVRLKKDYFSFLKATCGRKTGVTKPSKKPEK